MADDKTTPAQPEETVSLGEVVQGSVPTGPVEGTDALQSLDTVFRTSMDTAYPKLSLTKSQAVRVGSFLSELRLGGAGGVRLLCAGDECVYRKACPLWKEKEPQVQIQDPEDPTQTIPYIPTKAPTGEPCPIEATVVMDTRIQYSTHPDFDLENPAHRSYLNELCLLASVEWRVNMLLSFDFHSVTQNVPATVSPSGEVFCKEEISPLLQTLTMVNDRRSKIMKEMGLSREASAKVSNLLDDDGDSKSRTQSKQKAEIKEAATAEVQQIPEHVQGDPSYHEPVSAENSDESTQSGRQPNDDARKASTAA